MSFPEALLISGSTTIRCRDSEVAKKLRRAENGMAVLLETSKEFSEVPRSETRLLAIAERIENSDSCTQRTAVPMIIQNSRDTSDLVVVSIAYRGPVGLVTVQHLAETGDAWGASMASATDESLLSILRRVAGSAKFSTLESLFEEVERDIGQLNAVFLANMLAHISTVARRSLITNSDSSSTRRKAFEEILDIRSTLHTALTHLESNGLEETKMGLGLRRAGAGCDTSITMLTAVVAIVVQEQEAALAQRHLETQQSQQQRDRRLSRLATTLIPPGLWFGFAGSNAFPSQMWGWTVQSEVSTLGVLAVGLILSIVGWFVIPQKEKNDI